MDSMSSENNATRKRGCTSMAKLVRKRGRDEKVKLEWNPRGQAIGKNRSSFMSYIGVSSRTLVDINFPRWDRVPKEIKESVWKDVSSIFEVPDDKYPWVINIAGERWKDFKSRLKKFFMYDEGGNICLNPPHVYPFIDQEMWDKFITYRQSDEFKEQSARNREISKRNLYTYKGSRKGYAGIEEEILANKDNNNSELSLDASSSTPIIPRSLLWKKARTDKKGNMDELTRQVVDKMDSLSQQAARGEIVLSGRQDILSAALGTKEHPGRVRGAGPGVTITAYFGRDGPPPTKFADRLNEMEAQVMALKRIVTELQSSKDQQTSQPCEMLFSSGVVASCPEFPEGWTECKLASSEPSNPIVAIGKVFNTHGTQPVMLHNKILEPGYMKVTIIDPKIPDAPLPIPIDEVSTIFEAVGAFVAWPKKLIFCSTTALQLSLGDKDGGLVKQNGSTQSKALQLPPGDKDGGLSKQNGSNQSKALQLPPGDKDGGLSKQNGSTQSKVLAPTQQSQSRPLRLIIRNATTINDNNKSDKGEKDKGMGKQTERSQPQAPASALTTQSRPSQSNQVAVQQQQKLTTLTMKLMYRCVRGMTSLYTITMDMPLAVMYYEHNILITKDEILQWLFQENTRASHVSVYIKYLFSLCEEWGILEMFGFLRPQNISLEANHVEEEQGQYIVDATKGARKNKMFFAPYNDGKRWMLCAFHPQKDEAYWLDPAGSGIHPGVKKQIDTAIRKFHAHRRRKKPKSNTKWYEIECPHEPNIVDSGYYILRYMHEIIEKREDYIPEQYYEDSPAPGAYQQHHIDETRDRWIEFVQNHMD